MSQIITRMYASPGNAASAVNALKTHRFGDNEVFVVGPSAGATHDDVVASIGQAGIGKGEASPFAHDVLKGATLVVVHAPFGAAKKASLVLDRYQPVPIAVVAAAPIPFIRYDEAAPLSTTLQWPTTLMGSTPLSDYWRLPTLTDFSASRRLGFDELSEESAPLSKAVGMPVLSDDPTPLSSKLKMPLLRD